MKKNLLFTPLLLFIIFAKNSYADNSSDSGNSVRESKPIILIVGDSNHGLSSKFPPQGEYLAMAKKYLSNTKAYLGLAWHVAREGHKKTVARGIWNKGKIARRSAEIQKTTNGTTNIVGQILKELKEEGYDDLNPYLHDIVEMSLNPDPNTVMLAALEEVTKKNPDLRLFLVSAKDHVQLGYYLDKMAAKGAPLDPLFDGYVAAYCPIDKNFGTPQEGFVVFHGKNAMCDEGTVKPSPEFFGIVKRFVEQQVPNAEIIFTDNDPTALVEAEKAGFKTIPMPGNATRLEIQKGVEEWKKTLQGLMQQKNG